MESGNAGNLYSVASTMKMLVYCPYSNLQELAELTMPNKREYCETNGYGFETHELGGAGINIVGQYTFRRMGFVLDKLKNGEWDKWDWIWVCGLDVLITNMLIKLESIADGEFGLIHSCDALDPCLACMDSYLVSRKAIPLLEAVMSHRDNPIGGMLEQSTTYALVNEERFKGIRKLLPQRVMNSYQYKAENFTPYNHCGPGWPSGTDCLGHSGEWQPGDFCIHVGATNSVEFKLGFIREFLKNVQH